MVSLQFLCLRRKTIEQFATEPLKTFDGRNIDLAVAFGIYTTRVWLSDVTP